MKKAMEENGFGDAWLYPCDVGKDESIEQFFAAAKEQVLERGQRFGHVLVRVPPRGPVPEEPRLPLGVSHERPQHPDGVVRTLDLTQEMLLNVPPDAVNEPGSNLQPLDPDPLIRRLDLAPQLQRIQCARKPDEQVALQQRLIHRGRSCHTLRIAQCFTQRVTVVRPDRNRDSDQRLRRIRHDALSSSMSASM